MRWNGWQKPVALIVLIAMVMPAVAQQPSTGASQPEIQLPQLEIKLPLSGPAQLDPNRALPPSQATQHVLELPGRVLSFTATVGIIAISNSAGRALAEFSYVAYTIPGTDKTKRPVMFAFNGGPGSASAWLHMGLLGPWRMQLDSKEPSPSATPVVVPNAETFLDFADLVLVDPVGTGYSRFIGGPPSQNGDASGRAGSRDNGGPRHFWTVNGDAESVAQFIQAWLRAMDRLASPKIIVGESYGGIRAPKVAHLLQTRYGVGINAMVLVSPALDFGIRGSWRGSGPTGLVSVLPSLAASAIERQDSNAFVNRSMLEKVEAYARSEYLVDLLRGPSDTAALERMVKRVAEFVGLPETVVRQYDARLDSLSYRREANRATGKFASIYDSSVMSFEPEPKSHSSTSKADPFTSGYSAPLTTAITDLYTGRLGYRNEAAYVLANRDAQRQWVYPNSPFAVESVGDLKAILAQDPKLKVLVAHGFTDTITPYFGSELVLSQIPAYGDPARLNLVVYPGGHMFYSREASRKAFRDDVAKLLE